MFRNLSKGHILLGVAAAIAFSGAPAARAATIPVNATEDAAGTDGECSLREALQAAAFDAAIDGCPAGSSAVVDTVTVPAGTYPLTQGHLEPQASVTISGAGAGKTIIDALNQDRAFELHSPGVRIDGVTITRGRAPDAGPVGADPNGGAILIGASRNEEGGDPGSLTLTASRITASRAGDGAPGSANADQQLPGGDGGYGGAVALEDGALTVVDSTFSGNRAGDGGHGFNPPAEYADDSTGKPGTRGGAGGSGGALVNYRGTLLVQRSTLAGNTAGNGGPGGHGGAGSGSTASGYGLGYCDVPGSFLNDGYAGGDGGAGGAAGIGGGAIFGTASAMSNVTIVGNAAGSPGAVGAGGAGGDPCNASGVAGDTGASGAEGATGSGGAVVQGSGELTLTAATIADNSAAQGTALSFAPEGGGTVRNSILNGTCLAAVPASDGGHDLRSDPSCPGTTATVALGPLADNGGLTQTRLPDGTGNPAVDAIPATNNACSGTDQRGVTRPQNGLCDIGAVELTPAAAPPDTTITTGPSGDGNATTATFTFTATRPGATFTCALDGAAPAACSSPAVYTDLAPGAHTFQVTAADGGLVDQTPAERTWSVAAPAGPTLSPPPNGTETKLPAPEHTEVTHDPPTPFQTLADNRLRVDVGAVDRADTVRRAAPKLRDGVKVACGKEKLDPTSDPCRGTLVLALVPARYGGSHKLPSTAKLALKGAPASVLAKINPSPSKPKSGAAVVLNPVAFPGRDYAALNPQPFPPGEKVSLNPQPFPPGEDVSLNPQPFPPGEDVSLNPQPFPPKETNRPTVKVTYLGAAPYGVGVGTVKPVTVTAGAKQLRTAVAGSPKGFTVAVINVTDAGGTNRTADVVAKTGVKVR